MFVFESCFFFAYAYENYIQEKKQILASLQRNFIFILILNIFYI